MARGPSRREKDVITGGKTRASQQKKASRFKGSEASDAGAAEWQSVDEGLNLERKESDRLTVDRKRSAGKMARTLVETSSCPVELRQGASGWYVLVVCVEFATTLF